MKFVVFSISTVDYFTSIIFVFQSDVLCVLHLGGMYDTVIDNNIQCRNSCAGRHGELWYIVVL